MKKRVLGNMEVSAVGLGCMGFSTGYGAIPEESESIRLIRLAFEKGCTLFDTAEQYAAMRNEELVGKALEPIRNQITLVSKYAPVALPGQKIGNGKDQLVNCDRLASSVLHPVRNFQLVLPFFPQAEPG